jgi:hypothetical protein
MGRRRSTKKRREKHKDAQRDAPRQRTEKPGWFQHWGWTAALLMLICAIAFTVLRYSGENTKDAIENLEKLVSAVAIIIGGAWAYWRFGVTREGEWNLEVTVDAKALPYGTFNTLKVLVVTAKLANVGKTLFLPGKDGVKLTLSWLNNKMSCGKSIDDALKRLGDEIDMLRYYDNYYIEPGCTYREVEAIVVPANAIVSVIVTAHGLDTSVDGEVVVCT